MEEKNINTENIKADLVDIYKKFLLSPESEINKKNALKIYTKFIGIGNLIPNNLSVALNFLSDLSQCGEEGFDKER